MNRTLQVFLALAIAALAAIGLKAVWQAGWDAHQTLSDAERASTLAANAKAAQSASQTLSYDLGKVSALDASTSQILLEIESYAAPSDAGLCGVSVDRVRQLEQFR